MRTNFRPLAERLSPHTLATGAAIPPLYRSDAFRAHRGSLLAEEPVSPAAVAWPRSTEELATVVRFAAAAGSGVVPWGSGTDLMGGARL